MWPWPEVKCWPWPFKVIIYIFRRALPRGTRWCLSYAASFLSSKVIRKNRFLPKTAIFCCFWPLPPKPLMLAQLGWQASERIAQELLNVFFSGLLTILLSEIMVLFQEIWNFAKFDLRWPLVTSIMTLAKNRPKHFRNDIRRAFERIFRFLATTSRSPNFPKRFYKYQLWR